MRLRIGMLIVGACVLLCTASAQAQRRDGELEERFLRQQRMIDEELHRQRATVAPIEEFADLEWGGWLEYYLFHYDDGVQSSRLVQRPGMAVWTRLRLDNGAHEIFARAKIRYTWFEPGDEIERQQDWWGPNIEQLWYDVDIGRATRLIDPSGPVQLRARIGRQPTMLGTGYTLDMPLDAVWLDARLWDWRVQGLFGRTIPSFPNIDRSEAVDSHSRRNLYGVQVAYEGWQRHVPFVYALWNNDKTDERPLELFQDYSYDSFYIGGGVRGELWRNLKYWAEGVFESGHSYADGAWMKQDYIEAYGWDVGVEQLFDVPTHPRVSLQYMFASGDRDRLLSPNSTVGGNRFGTKDSSLVTFGFRDTGIALAPTLSNLHVWRVGAAAIPLEKIELFRHFEIGANWFLYHKHRSRGAISDPLAEQFSGYVGWEMDYFINWRVTSDVSWTARWGTFFPGSAYRDRDSRHFLFTGVTWSF